MELPNFYYCVRKKRIAMVKLTPLFGLPILARVWREEIRSGTVADQGALPCFSPEAQAG